MNEELFAKFMNDRDFQLLVAKGLGQRVYDRLPKTADYRPSAMSDGTATES
jgi:hypothetical protein